MVILRRRLFVAEEAGGRERSVGGWGLGEGRGERGDGREGRGEEGEGRGGRGRGGRGRVRQRHANSRLRVQRQAGGHPGRPDLACQLIAALGGHASKSKKEKKKRKEAWGNQEEQRQVKAFC